MSMTDVLLSVSLHNWQFFYWICFRFDCTTFMFVLIETEFKPIFECGFICFGHRCVHTQGLVRDKKLSAYCIIDHA